MTAFGSRRAYRTWRPAPFRKGPQHRPAPRCPRLRTAWLPPPDRPPARRGERAGPSRPTRTRRIGTGPPATPSSS
ncbi:hypothetical protein FNH09_01735 [Streptomyces adustus]|uniref:Uncharacterized protein n=1 Tax=Streptomyces adustus TaxID=1609272 RepID=A0A5N8V4K3_9ACTN|nr:hypothetical protein [Streptomyces adustus]